MMTQNKIKWGWCLMVLMGLIPIQARTKLVALPERQATVIRLDHPQATLIEEERVLTLQEGLNKVDFSWKSVGIDADSIRLTVVNHPEQVRLLSVSYPPNESALVWEIASDGDFAETVRISYLLGNIDRLVTYKAVANQQETEVDLKSFLILRNFSGEDFDRARIQLDYGKAFERAIRHEETKQLLFLETPKVPVQKIWTFDAAQLPWDPEELDNQNVGIPVSYRIVNDPNSHLGEFALWNGKVRLFQQDGKGGTIFLGEDNTPLVPIGAKTELYVGNSRDIVVTQRKLRDQRINLRRNNDGQVVLYDTDELIVAKLENFKDSPAQLTLIQHIPGQWDMKQCTMDDKPVEYKLRNAFTLVFEVAMPARRPDGPAAKELKMSYSRRNIPEGPTRRLMQAPTKR